MRHGAGSNPPNRFEALHYEPDPEFEEEADPGVQYFRDPSRSIIARNQSPDIGYDASINPYRGCTHGWLYSHFLYIW